MGGEGMLGHKLYQVLSQSLDTVATTRRSAAAVSEVPVYRGRAQSVIGGVDVADFDTVTRAFARAKPSVVVNCIGVVKHLPEGQDPLISLSVNSLFPHRLAELCAATGARLIHMSTDCVFSGTKGGYQETDPPDASDLYGRTKLLGEVTQAGCLTLRTSIIGRDFHRDTGLLEWFLSRRGGKVRGYRRMIFSGFPTKRFAEVIRMIIVRTPALDGRYHIASAPISKYDLLLKLRDAWKLDVEIEPVDDPACDRSLDGTRFREATHYVAPDWDELVDDLVTDSTPYDVWRTQHATARG